jgi:hypothetical protein
MNRHIPRTFVNVEQLERREVPSATLPATAPASTMNGPVADIYMRRRLLSDTATTNPVSDIRLRRIVWDTAGPGASATAALMVATVHADRPTESISLNF